MLNKFSIDFELNPLFNWFNGSGSGTSIRKSSKFLCKYLLKSCALTYSFSANLIGTKPFESTSSYLVFISPEAFAIICGTKYVG